MFSLASRQLIQRAAALSTAAAAGYALSSSGAAPAALDDAASSLRDFFPTPESLYRVMQTCSAVSGQDKLRAVFTARRKLGQGQGAGQGHSKTHSCDERGR